MQPRKKLLESRSGRLVLGIVVVLFTLLAISGVADRHGRGYLNESMKRTLFTFGVARTINGVISVAQGTEVAVEPVGVGVNFAPGEILDPVNDMIERFSWVMLSASASLGLQQLLSELSEWFPVTLIYTLSGLALIAVLLFYTRTSEGPRLFVLRLFVLLTIARFLIPAVSVTAESIHQGFLKPRYDAAVERLDTAGERIGSLNEEGISGPKKGDSDKPWWKRKLLPEIDVDKHLTRYKEVAADITSTSVELIVIFLFQTLLLPLAVVWFGAFLFRSTMRVFR